MKLIYALMFVPLILIAIIVVEKILVLQSIGTFSTLIVSALLFLAFLGVISLRLYQRQKRQTVRNLWLAVASSILTYTVVDLMAGYLFIKPLSPPSGS